MIKPRIIQTALAGVFALGLSACSDGTVQVQDTVGKSQPANLGPENIVGTAVAAGDFTILATALSATGLDTVLADGDRNFTVFAPTDAAFNELGQDTINNLLNDTEQLKDILLYHVLADTVVNSATAIGLAGQTVNAANDDSLSLSVESGNLFINMSQVVSADVGASNGIIHVIDAVLLPPSDDNTSGESSENTIYTAAINAGLDTFVAAAKVAGLKDALNHPGDIYTVFAPSEAAFAALGTGTLNTLVNDPDTLRNILLYHVLPGTTVDAAAAVGLVGIDITAGNGTTLQLSQRSDGLYVQNSRIVITDIPAVNGVIHVIDAVLIP